VLLGFGVMLGVVRPRTLGKFIAALIFGPILIAVALIAGRAVFASLSLAQQILLVVPASLIGLAVLLRIILPRDIWAGVVSAFIYDVLKYLFGLPARLVRWLYLKKLGW
jgi:hypothetical protein